MSRSQKLLLSMLGSILLHCLLALMFFSGLLLPSMRATSDKKTIAEPEEVVILLSDLLPDPLDGGREKMFVRTDPDSESSEAPDAPQFESDRNTLAATEFLPEPDAESVDGMPTIQGRVDFPGFELRDRDFSDGDGDSIELPAPGSQAVSVAESVPGEVTNPVPPSQQQATDAMASADSSTPDSGATVGQPSGEDGSGDAKGAPESPDVAENLQRPVEETDDAAVEELAENAPSNPVAGNVPVVMSVDGDSGDREVDRKKPSPTALVGSPSSPKSAAGKSESDATPGSVAKQVGSASDSASESQVGGAMAASSSQAPASSETPAFNPETRANHVSGTLSNLGDKTSVDAEGTELGRYKQGVVTAIEKSWHRFRLSNRDDVTAGNLRLRFRVDSGGKVRNLKILRAEANNGMTEFTLKAILAADIPSMPKEVASVLGSEGLVMNYTVLVFY
jgi:hypothetical protein